MRWLSQARHTAPLALTWRPGDGDPVAIKPEEARQPLQMPVCLLRLHVEHACAAVSHRRAEDGCHVLGQLPCKLAPDGVVPSCVACACQQGGCQALHPEGCRQGVDDDACVRAEQPARALAHWDAYSRLHALCWQPNELIVCCCKACCTCCWRAVEDQLQMAVHTPAGAPPCHLPEAVPKVPRQAPAGVLLQGLPVRSAERHPCWHPSELQLAHGRV